MPNWIAEQHAQHAQKEQSEKDRLWPDVDVLGGAPLVSCPICGAVVRNIARHEAWHQAMEARAEA
jgi:hypothetical protein